MKEFIIRAAVPEDAGELRLIYAPYVTETAVTSEYMVPSEEEFEERIRNTLKKYPYIVAEGDDGILGYTYAGPYRIRAAYGWAVESSIYVRKDDKRTGVGRVLYTELENALKEQGFTNINACIAHSHQEDEYLTRASVHFHEKMGYSMVGEFHDVCYKFGRWYNMVWMEKHIAEHVAEQTEIVPFCMTESGRRLCCR